MICLDSDIIIDIIKGKRTINVDDELCTTSVNVHELLVISNKQERDKVYMILNMLYVLPMQKNSSIISSKIFRELKQSGKEIGNNDAMIAGIMKSLNCSKILTNNKKHFERINGIEI